MEFEREIEEEFKKMKNKKTVYQVYSDFLDEWSGSIPTEQEAIEWATDLAERYDGETFEVYKRVCRVSVSKEVKIEIAE